MLLPPSLSVGDVRTAKGRKEKPLRWEVGQSALNFAIGVIAATADHSYSGAVISEAGIDPQVQALVYVAAFVPDAGESVSTLVANSPPGSAAPPILPPLDSFLLLDKAKFASVFAADVYPEEAQFMADSQLGWSNVRSWPIAEHFPRHLRPGRATYWD